MNYLEAWKSAMRYLMTCNLQRDVEPMDTAWGASVSRHLPEMYERTGLAYVQMTND